MELGYLRRQLSLWGRLCRAVGVGYPTMSTTERARIGRGGSFDGPSLPDDIAEIDALVARIPPQHKLILVEAYTKSGEWYDHAARLQLSKDAYFRRKKTAEVYLNAALMSANDGLRSMAS
jgi:hypothetical protein